ncbi:MAG: hypothetical protein QM499_02865 [Flavobacteriaceae bacterium]
MKKQTKLLIALVLVITGGYFAYNYMYQDHRDIQSEEAKVTVSASELVSFFKDNKSEEILNSTVQISGVITEMDTKSITLDDNVQCSFDEVIKGVNINDKITVKGRCIGYDDLFEIVKLDQSTIIK